MKKLFMAVALTAVLSVSAFAGIIGASRTDCGGTGQPPCPTPVAAPAETNGDQTSWLDFFWTKFFV